MNENVIVEVLAEAAKGETPEALYAISEMLWREQERLVNRDWFCPLFLRLAVVKADHGATLLNIDMIMMGWVQNPDRQPKVLEFLNAWIAEQPRQTLCEAGLEEYFSATFNGLAAQGALLNRTLTSWLLKDDSRYPLVAQKALSRLRVSGVTSVALDPVLIDKLEPNEIRFLVRRILGYVIGEEIQISLIFSLVHTRDAAERALPWVASVLRDQVGYDYPHQTIEFLKARESEPDEANDVKALCADITAALQEQLDTNGALPILKEFLPASSKVRRFAKERGKQMNKVFEEASKDSIWRQIVSHVVLKAGRRSFRRMDNRYTEPMELKSMSHGAALPRSEISDPAGAARNRLFCRSAKKDTP